MNIETTLREIAKLWCSCGTLLDAQHLDDPPSSHKCGSCLARVALGIDP